MEDLEAFYYLEEVKRHDPSFTVKMTTKLEHNALGLVSNSNIIGMLKTFFESNQDSRSIMTGRSLYTVCSSHSRAQYPSPKGDYIARSDVRKETRCTGTRMRTAFTHVTSKGDDNVPIRMQFRRFFNQRLLPIMSENDQETGPSAICPSFLLSRVFMIRIILNTRFNINTTLPSHRSTTHFTSPLVQCFLVRWPVF